MDIEKNLEDTIILDNNLNRKSKTAALSKSSSANALVMPKNLMSESPSLTNLYLPVRAEADRISGEVTTKQE